MVGWRKARRTAECRGARPKRKRPIRGGGPAVVRWSAGAGGAYQVSGYCTLNWALVPGVEPQSYSCRIALLAVLAPRMFRQRPEATFLNA